MRNKIDNGLFHEYYHNLKVLLFAPHEDDEIFIGGSLIYWISKTGAEIHIAYATNGDFKYKAKIRIEEAIASATLLGVHIDHIYFMGYGDTPPAYYSNHVFYHENDIVESLAGFSQTYGVGLYQDFAFKYRGRHNDYTASQYLEDILDIIRSVEPDLIICSDLDEHPDHKMLSITFDKAIGIIKKKNPDYNPEVWKTFAYSLSYFACPDFSSINNPETKRPILGVTNKYSYEIIDNYYYSWVNRIRIPVPAAQRKMKISDCIITKALNKHKSQRIITRADRIINSDEVFFLRRTDNLAFYADISVSSGNSEHLVDFMVYNINNIEASSFSPADYYWKPDDYDKEKKIRFSWKLPTAIEEIKLYAAYSSVSCIKEISIVLSDGYKQSVYNLPQDGSPMSVNIGKHKDIYWCEISIISYQGDGYGISECEIFSLSDYKSVIKPFCKIMINGNFVYKYICSKKLSNLSLELYKYNTFEEINIEVKEGKSYIIGNTLYIDKNDKEIVLRASNESGNIYDQIEIVRESEQNLRAYNKIDVENTRFIKKKKKKKILLYAFKDKGLDSLLKRTWNNVLKPKLKGTKKRI